MRARGVKLRETGEEEEVLDTTDDSVRSAVRTDVPIPEPPFWGVREIEVDREELYTHLDTHVLFKLHWGGRGVKGEEWRKLLDEDFRPRLERMWAEPTTCTPARCSATSRATPRATTSSCWTRRTARPCSTRFTCPRQPKGDRLCLADFYRPKDSGELDVVALQAVTVGDEVTELMAKLEQEGEFAEQLFIHGLGVQTAEGLAEWLHWRVRNDLGIDVTPGPPLLVGLPGGAGPVRAPQGRAACWTSRRSAWRSPTATRRSRAVDAGARRAPPAGGLLRHAQRAPAADGSPDDVIRGTRATRRVRGRSSDARAQLAAVRAARMGSRREGARIDGGGIRGLIPALVLAEIERRTGRPIAALVDLIAGTSTGGILACALARPNPMPREPRSPSSTRRTARRSSTRSLSRRSPRPAA